MQLNVNSTPNLKTRVVGPKFCLVSICSSALAGAPQQLWSHFSKHCGHPPAPLSTQNCFNFNFIWSLVWLARCADVYMWSASNFRLYGVFSERFTGQQFAVSEVSIESALSIEETTSLQSSEMRQQSPIWNYEWPTHWLTAVRMAYVGGAEWKSNEGGRLERGCHQSCGGWDWQQDGRWRCLIPIYLKYLSAAAASTAAHLLVRRSVAMYCNRSWVLLALLHSASHCCTLLHSTSLRRFVCKECPSASPFNIVPPSSGDMHSLQCVYVDTGQFIV